MANKHARLAASAAERWMNCAGSVNMEGPSGGTTTFPAAQGTYAHALAAECLTQGHDPARFLGQSSSIDGHLITCDQEMVEGIGLYLDTIAELRFPGGKQWVELPLVDALSVWHKDLGGTADYVTLAKDSTILRVVDFKYGAGKFVAADDNKQLMIYALGAMLSVATPVKTVEVYIVQPRYEGADPVRMQAFPAWDLMDFAGSVKTAAELTRDPNAPLAAGPWCSQSFCPHAARCPELEKHQGALIAQEFGDVATVDPKKLSHALSLIPLVKERIKSLEELAYSFVAGGNHIPGFKLVDKRPRRQWTDERALAEWAKRLAINPYEEPALKSPAQLEKGLKKAEKEELKQFYVSVSSGSTLVPDTDSRAPISKMVTADDFDAIGSASEPKQLTATNLFD